MEGWILLYRQFLNWEWYDDNNVKILFIHCLLKANHKDKDWRGQIIKRGSFFTSISHLSNETNLTIKQVRMCLSKLEKTKEIEQKGASNGTMISICKYDSYQTITKTKGQTKGKQRANEGQQLKNDKEYKEDIYRNFGHLKLSISEYKNLIELQYRKKEIDDILDRIENFKGNTKYKSLYLTCKNWLKKEYPDRINFKIQ